MPGQDEGMPKFDNREPNAESENSSHFVLSAGAFHWADGSELIGRVGLLLARHAWPKSNGGQLAGKLQPLSSSQLVSGHDDAQPPP